MKKSIFLVFCALALGTLQTSTASTEWSSIVHTIVNLIRKPQAREIPTITVGWLDITDDVSDFEKIFMPLSHLVEEPTIDAIIIRISSGGGSPGDSQIIASYIKKARIHKPIIAFISRLGASGAYWIASSCSYTICPEVAEVGSIGAASQFIFDKDKHYHLISSGALKVPVVDQHYALDQKFIEQQVESNKEIARVFAQSVSESRNIPLETILSWEGALFPGTTALQYGLVDQNGTLPELIDKTIQLVHEKNNQRYQQVKLIDPDGKVLKVLPISS